MVRVIYKVQMRRYDDGYWQTVFRSLTVEPALERMLKEQQSRIIKWQYRVIDDEDTVILSSDLCTRGSEYETS